MRDVKGNIGVESWRAKARNPPPRKSSRDNEDEIQYHGAEHLNLRGRYKHWIGVYNFRYLIRREERRFLKSEASAGRFLEPCRRDGKFCAS